MGRCGAGDDGCARSSPHLWLLALLALRTPASGYPSEVARPWLAGTLWPESAAPAALANLRNALKDLRRALGPEAHRLHCPTTRTVSLDLTGAALDVREFDAALRAGDPASLRRAIALYRGPLLEECAEEWVFLERQAREQAYLQALEALAAGALAEDDPAAAERYLRRAVAVDPLRESAQRALMQVLAASGNYAAALLCYRELRLLLHRELNAQPDAETQTLFQQLRSEGRRLAAKGIGGGEGARGRGGEHEHDAGLAPSPRPPIPPSPSRLLPAPELPAVILREALARAPIVGREAELATLERRLAAAVRGDGGVVLLAGEPGIGKTRLATEAGALARQRGARVLIGRCEEQGAAPYQPFAEALRGYLGSLTREQAEALLPPPVAGELVRLVPRLAERVKEVPRAGAASGAAARQALDEAMGEFFALLTRQQGPALLFLEDLHWADEGSLAMLPSLARRAMGLPLLIVGTYRDLPPDLQRPLEQTLAALNRERLSERIPLRRLPEAGVEQMVVGLLEESFEHEQEHEHEHKAIGEEDEPAAERADSPAPGTPACARARARKPSVRTTFVSALHRETEGNPFFVEEVLQHLVEEGAIYRRGERWQIHVLAEFQAPASVQAAIGRRLEHLAAESREALTLAAVIGPQFDFEVLLQAIMTSDESRVTRKGAPDSSLVRVPATRADHSSLLEERLLGWVEEWLGAWLVIEEPGREGSGEHYRFQHALIREVVYGGVSRRRQGQLHERVGWALETVCSHDREAPLEELARHFARARSQAAREKGVEYCLRAGDRANHLAASAEAIQHFRRALRLLEGLPEDEAHWQLRWQATERLAGTHRRRLEYESSRQVLEENRAWAQGVGCVWGIAVAHLELARHFHRVVRVLGSGDIELARRHAETSLVLCEREGLANLLPLVRYHLAECLQQEPRSDLPRAAALLRQALDRREGLSPDMVQRRYGMLAEVSARLGQWDETMTALRESIAAGGVDMDGVAGLSLLEEALDAQGRQAEFIAFCDECRRLVAQTGAVDPLAHWYLSPAEPSARFSQVAFQDDFEGPALREEWQWCDPLQVSAYRLGERAGRLTLRAGEGTDLAPWAGFNGLRLLLAVRGEFALEARMEGDWDARDRIGSSGLLVWKDSRNFLRLKKFCMRFHYGSVGLQAMVQGEFRNVGRGLLRGDAFHLRLEREGERFTALCSTDGVHWLTCGQVAFPARDPLQVGITSLRGVVAHFDWVRVLTKP